MIEGEDLYCLSAGRGDANYARLLRFIDPAAWYRKERNPLRELLDSLETTLPFKPDIILFDARTGINPFNAPLLFDLADLAIVVFFPHPQTRIGTGALVRALLASKTRRKVTDKRLTPDIRFLVSPIPPARPKKSSSAASFRDCYQWLLSPVGFKEISTTINNAQVNWAQFWSFYTALAIQQGLTALSIEES